MIVWAALGGIAAQAYLAFNFHFSIRQFGNNIVVVGVDFLGKRLNIDGGVVKVELDVLGRTAFAAIVAIDMNKS